MNKRGFVAVVIFLAARHTEAATTCDGAIGFYGSDRIWVKPGASVVGNLAVGYGGSCGGSSLTCTEEKADVVLDATASLTGEVCAATVAVTGQNATRQSMFKPCKFYLQDVTGTTCPNNVLPSLPAELQTPVLGSGLLSNGSVTLASGEKRELEAGNFTSLTLSGGWSHSRRKGGSHLILRPGTYYFEDVTMGSNAKISAIGQVTIHVAGRWTAGKKAILQPIYGNKTLGHVHLYVMGENEDSPVLSYGPDLELTNKNVAVTFGIASKVLATIAAPKGTMWIQQYSSFDGFMLAKWLVIGAGTTVIQTRHDAIVSSNAVLTTTSTEVPLSSTTTTTDHFDATTDILTPSAYAQPSTIAFETTAVADKSLTVNACDNDIPWWWWLLLGLLAFLPCCCGFLLWFCWRRKNEKETAEWSTQTDWKEPEMHYEDHKSSQSGTSEQVDPQPLDTGDNTSAQADPQTHDQKEGWITRKGMSDESMIADGSGKFQLSKPLRKSTQHDFDIVHDDSCTCDDCKDLRKHRGDCPCDECKMFYKEHAAKGEEAWKNAPKGYDANGNIVVVEPPKGYEEDPHAALHALLDADSAP